MKLGDVIENLAQFDREDTIYACQPWTELSEAVVAREPEEGGLPPGAKKFGMKYFLEVSIAKEVIEDWVASLTDVPTQSELCRRMIDYATNDA